MITKGERTELRSVVRNQFKVLRHEVEQRKAELYAELEQDIHDRFSADDQKWEAMQFLVDEAVREANRRINDILYENGFEARTGSEHIWLNGPRMDKPRKQRTELWHVAGTRIEAQVKAALLRLDRDEADLLRTLAVGAIESEEARQFLASIPTVGELVSAARLAEIEASLTDQGDG